MFPAAALVSLTLAAIARAQQVGNLTAETHPSLSWQECTSSGCTDHSAAITIDANWRWLHTVEGYDNCYTGNEWDESVCTDGATCASSCALDGADYSGTYGITTSGDALSLKFVTSGQQKNIGSRTYLMNGEDKYQMFKLKNKEFTFTVDMSTLPCGLNGALYFVEMDEDGGVSKYPTNKAGAKYGTGYCDSQCPHDIKFINGEANSEGWAGSDNDPNAGTGTYGSCCSEMDIWEANSQAAAYTPHVCTVEGQTRCEGTDCGDDDDRYSGVCDKDGCDFNSYRMGDTTFLGEGLTIDTTQPITVVTQFITADNTTSGALSEIRRLYVQGGEVVANSATKIEGLDDYDSITDQFCADQKEVFGDQNYFGTLGGLEAMGESLDRGHVLVMSIWDDHAVNMLWLDSDYPLDKDPSEPGVSRGPCGTDSGVPTDVEAQSPDATVIYSAIKFGDIGTTYSA
ncbi:glycoside hydrolase family 7 protein [Schizophyllum commune H4-8]|uniref:Glucanase n=2 Tax=Schizophyllum commune TaxID=5334 RepID=D8QBJ3_SCHCM|nr:glycoside hydrolase family 7 protein [Schizophyllum commune H4-8]AAX55505.1 cellobiohydrolase [Schizophyllum commune]KAI5889197.1 glycoside hydrolase family 7 protein [Schizophyllum commune H4-8]